MLRIQKNIKIKIVFRASDLYELPGIRKATTDVWVIKTAMNLEKPRFVVIGFQKNTWENNIGAKAWNLTSADITSIILWYFPMNVGIWILIGGYMLLHTSKAVIMVDHFR